MLSDPLLVGIAQGVVFFVGFFASKKTLLLTVSGDAANLRLVGGFALALFVGWMAGILTAMLAYALFSPVLQYSFSADQLFLPLIGKSFLFAGMGAGQAAWSLRKQATQAHVRDSQVRKKGSKPASTNNNSYAEALAEIEEGRIDKGTWARSFADSGGDESKAKAAYIKSRAISIESAAELTNTRPQDDAPSGEPASTVSATTTPKAGNFNVTTGWLFGGIAVVGIVAAVALPAYQDYSKRRALAATPVPPTVPGEQRDQFGGTLVNPTSGAPEQAADLKPFIGKLDNYHDAVKAIERRDFTLALNILRPLAENGNPDAQWRLGQMYAHGEGVATDYTEVAKWYLLAAGQGNAFVQFNLATMYAEGKGVAQDYVQAHKWFNLAATAGVPGTTPRLEVIEQSMTPQQIAQAQQMARDCQQRNFKGCN